MKNSMTFIGLSLVVIGVIWILQGLNILPGSFMTGQVQWAINGTVSLLFGAILMAIAYWRKTK